MAPSRLLAALRRASAVAEDPDPEEPRRRRQSVKWKLIEAVRVLEPSVVRCDRLV